MQDADIQKLLAGHQGTLLELLQWLCKFLDGKEPAKHYDPASRRSLSKNGDCSRLPTYGASKEAFRRWKMRGAVKSSVFILHVRQGCGAGCVCASTMHGASLRALTIWAAEDKIKHMGGEWQPSSRNIMRQFASHKPQTLRPSQQQMRPSKEERPPPSTSPANRASPGKGGNGYRRVRARSAAVEPHVRADVASH